MSTNIFLQARLNLQRTAKNKASRASTRQPNDAVPGDETVRVPQDFINGTEFTSIDFGIGY